MDKPCPNPYCLQDREDADCPACGAEQFPPAIDWEAHKLLKTLKTEDDDDNE